MKYKKVLKYMFFFLPTLIIFTLLLYFSDIDKILETLSKIPLWTYAVIVLLSAFSWLLRGERWKVFLRLNKVKIRLIPSTALAVFGNFANWVVPARIGDIAWAYLAKKVLKTRLHITLVTIGLNRFLDFLSLLILLQLAFFITGKEMVVGWAKTFNLAALLVLLAFIIVLVLFLDGRLVLKLARGPLKKIKKLYLIVKESLLASTRNKEIFFIWTLLSIFIWIVEAFMAYILFVSIGININFFFILLAVIIGNLTKTLGISPGGAGTYEAGMALVIVGLTSLDYSVVLTIAILDHLLKKLFILVVGIITTNYYGLKLFSADKENYEKQKG